MQKAKSTKSVFDAIKAGSFSYTFHPDFFTSISDEHVQEIKQLYGDSLSFEVMTPEEKLEEAEVETADLPEEITEETQD